MRRACLRGLLLLSISALPFAQTAAAQPAITGISNAASGAPTIESGSWVSIYGTNLSATTRSWRASDFAGAALPTTIDNVTVLIDGKKAAIAYVSPGQLNVLAPADSATGAVAVQVTSPGGTANATATLASASPAFFTIPGGFAAARHNVDGVMVAPAGSLSGISSRAAVPGEVLQLYATGLGATNPAVPALQLFSKPAPLANLSQLSITVGGAAATIQYAGLVSPGVYQVNLTVPQLVDGNQSIVASLAGVKSQTGVNLPIKNSVSGSISVTLTPSTSTVRVGGTVSLTAKVSNTSNQIVSWMVNGVAGGNNVYGTISATGVYTAPAALPANAAITITAVSQEASSAQGTATVNLQNPVPAVSSVTPDPVNPGSATITVTGSNFVNGSVIYFAGKPLITTFVSSTQLTAAAMVAMPAGRLAAVKVTNPNPGSATSTPLAVPVRVGNEQVPYADAVRFLEMTTWGPAPQSVADLQTMGPAAWLAAQFNQPASAWPDPNTAMENVSRLQTAFFNVALAGSDQLRQRVAFALAQILVVSAVKDMTFEQMVSYQRMLGNYAFDTYRNAVNAVTLNPAMGDFLDMVNNVKANPAAGTAPNENYAREVMQLMTLGLVQLDPTGVPVRSGGSTIPEYNQTTVTQMAKVLTGWTYGQTPGFGSVWPNMPYYFSPMIAFENYHDATEKDLNLPIPCVIPAGGTAESDLSAALDCIFQQSNVAPFVSYRLIQRLVKSSPSPAYVGRVASAFQSNHGSLPSVITAILTDPEAQTPGAGKLPEPILYATRLLRALNANITAPDALTGQASAMGQTPLAPASVFSYFSPFYVIPALLPPTVAPEFQAMNASTAIARANFAYRVAANSLSSGITVDFSNLTDLANNPADLVEALNQALYRGEMDPAVHDALLTAASASTSPAARVRSALYAAAAAPQYQVVQ